MTGSCNCSVDSCVSPAEQTGVGSDARLRRKALLLAYFTVAYNVIEAVVAITAGRLAGSVALVGFGLDSTVESVSGAIIIWRFRTGRQLSAEAEAGREALATRLVGYTFFLLGLYVVYEALERLVERQPPDPSLVGLVLAVVSLSVMIPLARAKHRTGHALGSRSLMADAKETLACAWLSVALLLGLGLNYLWALWWADPVAGLIIAAFLFREGYEIVSGGDLCGCGGHGQED